MQDIDFLPASYRQQTVHRKANVWRLLVGGGFCAVLVSSFVYQQILYRQAARQRDELKPQYEQAQAVSQRLAATQADLKAATKQAELFTYLRHPWPRTRLLAAALGRLPDCVTLREIHISRGQSGAGESMAGRTNGKKADDAEAKKLDPAERDLNRLRDETAARETILVLTGITSDTAELQRYLVALGAAKLFEKIELSSLEANHDEQQGTWRFTARLGVRPGYGQTGGPERAEEKSITKSGERAALEQAGAAQSAPDHRS